MTQLVLAWLTNTLSAGVLGHAKCPQTDFECSSTGSFQDAENICNFTDLLISIGDLSSCFMH